MKWNVGLLQNATRKYWFTIKLRPFIIRYFFLIICIVGLMWHAVYTNYIIGRLRKDAVNSTRVYAELISAVLFDKMGAESENIVLEKIVREIGDIDMPIIITTPAWKPISWRNIVRGTLFNRREVPPDDDHYDSYAFMEKKIQTLKRKNGFVVIYGKDKRTPMGYLVYGSSHLISGLAWLPFIEGLFIVIFSAFVYFAFHNIMLTERSNLWVGLAKETAHQLGTPISSLMGWVEYMRTIRDAEEEIEPEVFIGQIHGICDDMQKDLVRLKKITNRFSQIGSKPTLVYYDLNDIIEENIKYFRTRLPLIGKRIEIKGPDGSTPKIPLNRDLLEWVLENLFKNSVDAINKTEGLIDITTEYVQPEEVVRIYHRDNGKGIPWEEHIKIFSPGYTTKDRGWGLGLTLAKRIIEDYHNGRIYVSWSQTDKGTTFCIDLPVKNPVLKTA